jgi:hypothetical protein
MTIVSKAAIEKLGIKRACEMAQSEDQYINASKVAAARFRAESKDFHGHEWNERIRVCWICGKTKERYRQELHEHTAEWCKGSKGDTQ